MQYKSLLLLLPAVLAADHKVNVGEGGLKYSPDKVTAAVGDTVTFHWPGSAHSVVQSTFDAPCKHKDGGINSGVVQSGSQDFVVTVKDTNPIWIYCSVGRHCQAGMVMVVNEPSGNDNLDAFKTKAASEGSSDTPDQVAGGVFGSGSASSSSGSSGSASPTGSESTTSMATESTMAMTTTITSGGSTVTSAVTSTRSPGAAVHHVGDVAAALGAAALAVLL